MSLKRLVVDENNFLRANTLNDMKTNATFHAGDVVEVAENYTFYKINSANATGGIAVANNLFAIPIKNPNKPDLSGYMPLAGNSTKSGNLTVTGTLNSGSITSTGEIIASGNVTAFSDKRLKAGIVPVSDIIDKISKINVYNFSMINDSTERKRVGVIAQELEEIFPELVYETEKEYLAVDYTGLSVYLLKAFQELIGGGK